MFFILISQPTIIVSEKSFQNVASLLNVCYISHYFIPVTKADLYKRDDPDWEPSVNMRGRQNLQPPQETRTSRYMRRVDRTQRKLEADAAHSLFIALKDVQNIFM